MLLLLPFAHVTRNSAICDVTYVVLGDLVHVGEEDGLSGGD